MDLKQWNELQCEILKELNLTTKDSDEIIKIGFLISHLKEEYDYSEAKKFAFKIVKKYFNY